MANKTIEQYAAEIAPSYGLNEEHTAEFVAYARQVSAMDPLALREAMSKGVPVRFGHTLLTARQMEIRGEPLSGDEEPARDGYAMARAAADRHEQAGDKKLAAFLREHLAAAEASDKNE